MSKNRVENRSALTEREADKNRQDSLDHFSNPSRVDQPDMVRPSTQLFDGKIDQSSQIFDLLLYEFFLAERVMNFDEGSTVYFCCPGQTASYCNQSLREFQPDVFLCIVPFCYIRTGKRIHAQVSIFNVITSIDLIISLNLNPIIVNHWYLLINLSNTAIDLEQSTPRDIAIVAADFPDNLVHFRTRKAQIGGISTVEEKGEEDCYHFAFGGNRKYTIVQIFGF